MASPLALPPRCSVVVLPMLPLGAPSGFLVFRDLPPTHSINHLRYKIACRFGQPDSERTNAVAVFLYRVEIPLDAFPGRTNWRFLSRVPLSQLLERAGYPAPMEQRAPYTTVRDLQGSTPLCEPPRVIHLIAEIIQEAPWEISMRDRYSSSRRLLRDVDPVAFTQLQRFLSSPPELLARATQPYACYPRAPFYLTNVPAIAQLTLPENKLFVRPVFAKLLDEILRDLPDKRRFVYVTATSGAGKTAFLWCVLHSLCRRGRTLNGQCLAPPMDIVLDVPGLFVLIDTAGHVFTGPRRECFRVELMKKETLYLADLAHGDHQELLRTLNHPDNDVGDHVDSFAGHASRLLVGLPRHRVEWRANRATRFAHKVAVKLLPRWKEGELELCRRACFPALDRPVLLARQALWGRQPLWTLALAPTEGVGEQRLADMIASVDRLERLMDSVVNNRIADELVSERLASRDEQRQQDNLTQLLLLRPVRSDKSWHLSVRPKFWRFGWTSQAVRDAVLDRIVDVQKETSTASLPKICPDHGSRRYIFVGEWPSDL